VSRRETVETVGIANLWQYTPLKRGVNEMGALLEYGLAGEVRNDFFLEKA
jgi:hypothetical protein